VSSFPLHAWLARIDRALTNASWQGCADFIASVQEGLGHSISASAFHSGAFEEDIDMKSIPLSLSLFVLIALVGTASRAADTSAKRTCLSASMVRGTDVVDGHTIIYRMRDGKVWKNTLHVDCPNLKFAQGFSQVIRTDEICANQQFIRVLGTGNTCQLGDFTLVETPKPQAN
jgi:hypothetical protein